jgi:uroporphyrinogen decarboxylase
MPDTISLKENLLRAITRAGPDFVPVRRLDGVVPGMVRLYYHGSRAPRQGTDRWGATWAGGAQAGQEWKPEIQGYAVRHPLADLAQLENYPFPDPGEPGLMQGLLDGVNRAEVVLLGDLPFLLLERANALVGMEALFMAMATEPDLVKVLFRRIADYQIAIVRRYIELGVDAIRGVDDYGAQYSLLISPQMWRELIKPELSRIYTVAKEAGLFIFHHSCGHIMELVPDLIEVGVDVLDPVQARANDHAQLKNLYGDKLSFMGGVDSQYVLTQGGPEEVEAAVKQCIHTLGVGGGYIMGPDHFVPVPEPNYRAYLSASERYGRYPLASGDM